MESKEIIEETRKVIRAYFDGKDYTPHMQGEGNVFVTLKKQGNLRGCIGTIQPDKLSKNLKAAAIYSLSDSRFSKVEREEFETLDIEVSVLKKGILYKNPLENLIIGKHGLIIEKDKKSGLLLPQVAIEHKMNKEQFLDAVCDKAGLDKGSWKDAKVWLFEAKVYKE
ncbi:MAG: AmmeMemoRadiSam system protein A [Candidatus Altiarchaeota archaeon]|nr:AmmeMemoRadiSam system protein A [Candidatus Altiarchaeota archaeon]